MTETYLPNPNKLLPCRFKDGVPKLGETSNELTMDPVTSEDAGHYRCRASVDRQGLEVFSDEAVLALDGRNLDCYGDQSLKVSVKQTNPNTLDF